MFRIVWAVSGYLARYAVEAGARCPEAAAMATTAPYLASVDADAAGVLRFRAFAHCGVSIKLHAGVPAATA